MLRNKTVIKSFIEIPVRYASTGGSSGGYPGAMRTALPRRPVKKIPLGKARPAIYYQFDVAVELTDGSVVMRRSQYPQDEIRLIQDQRSNPYWNPSRENLVDIDPNSVGSIEKFKQKYGGMFSSSDTSNDDSPSEVSSDSPEQTEAKSAKEEETSSDLDDFLDLLDGGEVESTPVNKAKGKNKK